MADEQIIQRMVTNIVQQNKDLIGAPPAVGQFRKILPALLEKGIDNIDLSMFSEEMRRGLLCALGEEYVRRSPQGYQKLYAGRRA